MCSLSRSDTDEFGVLQEMFQNLGELLAEITGFDSVSLQPNAGAAGEYAGLMVIRAYHHVIVCLLYVHRNCLVFFSCSLSLGFFHLPLFSLGEIIIEMSASSPSLHMGQTQLVQLCVECKL